jgi:signal transduction histidine kinase
MQQGEPVFSSELTLSERELFERVGWFTLVRWAAGILALLFIAMGWFVFHVRFDVVPAVACIITLFLYNAVFTILVRHLHQARPISRLSINNLAHAQIFCDLLAVATLVYFIGGVENHFIILFIFPMIVASEFFPAPVAYGYATIAAVLVNLIGWGEYLAILPHRTLAVIMPGGQEPLVSWTPQRWIFHLQVCVVITFALYATVFIAGSIAGRLRSREEELEQTYRNLQSLEQLKSQFMLQASHELRSPLATVQSLLNAALTLPPGDKSARELLERAGARCAHMTELIDDLLHYSRLRTRMPATQFEIIDLAEVVRSSVELFRTQAQEKRLQFDSDVGPVRIRGDRDSLAHLVNNLLSNAIRYTQACGRVKIELSCSGREGRLTVSDTGIGIAPEELPHIFDEFFRGLEAKRAVPQGTGLGMSIVRRVVDMHQWKIEQESVPGQGTTFRIIMPCFE